MHIWAKAMTGYEFFDSIPQSIKPDMAKVFLLATEAFSSPLNNQELPAGIMDEHNRYDWKKSQLHSRVMQQASRSMASRYFSVPPKEFMFISRMIPCFACFYNAKSRKNTNSLRPQKL
jgi:hypothetical protein